MFEARQDGIAQTAKTARQASSKTSDVSSTYATVVVAPSEIMTKARRLFSASTVRIYAPIDFIKPPKARFPLGGGQKQNGVAAQGRVDRG